MRLTLYGNICAQHNIFCGKPSFVDKKMDEKSRFGELSTEEMQEILDKDRSSDYHNTISACQGTS